MDSFEGVEYCGAYIALAKDLWDSKSASRSERFFAKAQNDVRWKKRGIKRLRIITKLSSLNSLITPQPNFLTEGVRHGHD